MDIKSEKGRSQILSGGRTSLKMKVSLTGIKTDAVTDAFFAREKGDKEVRPWDRSKLSQQKIPNAVRLVIIVEMKFLLMLSYA